MIKYILLFALTLANVQMCIGQCLSINFIKNSELEDFSCCANNLEMLFCANDWLQPTYSNAEYINTCALSSIIIDHDYIFLIHNIYFGNGCAGMVNYLFNNNVNPTVELREYIQGELLDSLVSGQLYYCEFWVKPFNFNNNNPYCAIDALGIFFSDTLPNRTMNDEKVMLFNSQVNNLPGNIISDTTNWTKISGTFYAKGGEKYFTVGTFKKEFEINRIYFGTPQTNYSYYFFDNFSLCPCEDTIPPDTVNTVTPVLEVYPNPASDNLFVLFDGYDQLQAIDLEIYNILGELVMNKQILSSDAPTSINIAPIASGCYAIVLKNGSSILCKDKLVVIK
ncbi:MAG TPA: T9SS type A sorting domain-containing protein [Bacteroidales bacterium]|nr:T9SS type A sorting domain-containing protein [Bacteroidales bacterium]HQN14809.1 T9SS type A sorting domain-containing protein [Bacteroidales bacterium]